MRDTSADCERVAVSPSASVMSAGRPEDSDVDLELLDDPNDRLCVRMLGAGDGWLARRVIVRGCSPQ